MDHNAATRRSSRYSSGLRYAIAGFGRLLSARELCGVWLVPLISAGLLLAPRASEAASVALGIESLIAQAGLSSLLAAFVIALLQWLRSSDARMLQHANALQGALRRYVPAAVVAQIEHGRVPEPGVREVSVLFADIRGFTSYSEKRGAAAICRMVTRYVERVCGIVDRHGGTVVEFSGDGIMAIFGAPDTLPEKERAAVAAGRAIVAAMRTTALSSTSGYPLSVGVGIATGEDFVGDICAGDRVIWSAVGNTSNLAARLQHLCREHDAAIVIDRATQRRLGDNGADFELRRDVPIRGWSNAHDVYILPLAGAGRALRAETRAAA